MSNLRSIMRVTTLILLMSFWAISQSSADCEITVNVDEGCEGTPISFTVTSADSTIVSQTWSYGDGDGSTVDNPSHVYGTSGSFTAEVTVQFAGGGSCTATIPITIHESPTAHFDADYPDPLCHSDAEAGIPFEDLSQEGDAPIIHWAWDFGDGNTSNDANPVNSYEFEGSWIPSLTVTDDNGCTDTYESPPIDVPAPLEVSFITDMNRDCPETDVRFTNTSNIDFSDVDQFYWEFGDGEEDHSQSNWTNFIHT